MSIHKIYEFLKESYEGWSQSHASLYAAALAYYTIFSLAPLIVICIAVATNIFSQTRVEQEIIRMTAELAGDSVALVVADILRNIQPLTSDSVLTSLGAVVTIYGASIIFLQLRRALNAMWGVAPRVLPLHQNIISTLKSYLLSAAAVLIVGGLVLIPLIISALWTAIPEDQIQRLVPRFDNWRPWLSLLTSPVLFTLVFALIFKTLPKATIRWRDVWPGAAVTAVFFWLGGYGIGLYLGSTGVASVYGAAGSLILLLIWVYYSAQIVLFGAKLTQVYAKNFGVAIEPHADAMFVSQLSLDN